MILGLLCGLWIAQPADALATYVLRRDPSAAWTAEGDPFPERIRLTSQTWNGIAWKHTVTIRTPAKLRHKGHAVLVITGGEPNRADEDEAQTLADQSGMPVATLYNIPNQPIWNLSEDALIAATLQKWFETRDDSWPLLFPMAKSAIAALDALQGATRATPNPLGKFVLTGGSKRGWTTWLAGSVGDSRITGIAPVVFDNLDMIRQMRHQKELWGDYSPMLRDYVRSGMMEVMETPDGRRLGAMIDPITYAHKVKCPVFLIHGANDPYWAPDALSLYWPRLTMPKSVLYLPNEGHTFREKSIFLKSLAAFAASRAGAFPWPDFQVAAEPKGDRISWRAAGRQIEAQPWHLPSGDATLTAGRWIGSPPKPAQRGDSAGSIALSARPVTGFLVLGRHAAGAHEFWLSGPIQLFRRASQSTSVPPRR